MIEKIPVQEDDKIRVLLIDYGLVSKYVDEDGKHLPKLSNIDTFKGNLQFSSLNTLNFNLPTRKDDLISLCYLLITMLNAGQMPFLQT